MWVSSCAVSLQWRELWTFRGLVATVRVMQTWRWCGGQRGKSIIGIWCEIWKKRKVVERQLLLRERERGVGRRGLFSILNGLPVAGPTPSLPHWAVWLQHTFAYAWTGKGQLMPSAFWHTWSLRSRRPSRNWSTCGPMWVGGCVHAHTQTQMYILSLVQV